MPALINAYINVSMAISLKHKLSIKVKQRNVCFDSLHVLTNLFLCDVSMAIFLNHELSIKVKQRDVCLDRLRVLVSCYFLYSLTKVIFLRPEFSIKTN